jgi:hypothetical protein
MDNHYHLLIETPSGNLPQIMRHINGAYTNYFNTKRKRSGHLFQGRYKAIIVDKDEYAKELSRYIHLNPVRAEMVESPEIYDWTSYQYYIGKKKAPEWLRTEFVLGIFGKTKKEQNKRYERFVTAMVGSSYESPLKGTISSTLLGSESFVKFIKDDFINVKKPKKDLPAIGKLIEKPSMAEIFDEVDKVFGTDHKSSRNIKLYLCKTYTAENLAPIGNHFNISDSAVSHVCKRTEIKIGREKQTKLKVDKIVKKLKMSKFKT